MEIQRSINRKSLTTESALIFKMKIIIFKWNTLRERKSAFWYKTNFQYKTYAWQRETISVSYHFDVEDILNHMKYKRSFSPFNQYEWNILIRNNVHYIVLPFFFSCIYHFHVYHDGTMVIYLKNVFSFSDTTISMIKSWPYTS